MVISTKTASNACIDLFAYEQVFLRYYSGLMVYANKMVFDELASEDIVHDVFENVWEKRKEIRPDTVQAYLFSSVRNRCINHLSKLKKLADYQRKVLEKGDVMGVLTWDHYVEKELREIIDKIIATLPEQARKVIIMNRVEDRSAQEIADILGLSRRTVEKHIELGLRHMKKKLNEYFPVLPWAVFLEILSRHA